MCEVRLQYGNRKTKWRFYTFFYRIPLYIYLKLFEYNDLKVNFDLSHYVLPLNDLTFVFSKEKTSTY